MLGAGCAALSDSRMQHWPKDTPVPDVRHFEPLSACGPNNEVDREEELLSVELLDYGLDSNDEGNRRANRRMNRLVSDHYFRVRLVHDETGEPYMVHVLTPTDFVTDFASVPLLAKAFYSTLGRHAEASVAHDWLFAFGFPKDSGGKQFADRVFHQAVIDADEWAPGRFFLWAPMRVSSSGNYGTDIEQIFAQDGKIYRPTPERRAQLREETVRICPAPPNGGFDALIPHLVPTSTPTPARAVMD